MEILGSADPEALERMVSWAGFSPDEFRLSETIAPATAKIPSEPIAGWVTVKRSSNGTARSYVAGAGYDWFSPFKNDLDAGIFGKP